MTQSLSFARCNALWLVLALFFRKGHFSLIYLHVKDQANNTRGKKKKHRKNLLFKTKCCFYLIHMFCVNVLTFCNQFPMAVFGCVLFNNIILVCRQSPTSLETKSPSHPSTQVPGTISLTPISQQLLRGLSIK